MFNPEVGDITEPPTSQNPSTMLHKVDTYQIPEWAIYALEYGTNECAELTPEDIAEIEQFTAQFPNGYVMDIKWEESTDFNRYPAFGLPCNTIEVDFYTDK